MRTSLDALRRKLARTRRTVVVSLTATGVLAASALAYGDGIDVSHYQGTINWSKVKAAGVKFAFMKVTEGSSYTDPTYAKNSAAAQAVGIYHGGYHFARPQVGTAATQAKYYLSKAGSFKTAGMLPPVLDLEATGGLSVSQLRTWTANWLETVEQLTGRTPIVYCSPSFWESNLGNSTAFHHYPLWIAHYGVSSPRVPGGWPAWTFWQRTSSGSVSGISGNVDMNRFNGTTAQLAALALSDGGSTDPVPPGPTVPTGDATTLTMTPSTASTAAINDTVGFAGDLTSVPSTTTAGSTPTPTPVAVPTRRVTLYAKDAGSTTWRTVASATTDTAGTYAINVPVPRTGSYQTRWAGDATYAPSVSKAVTVSTPSRTALTVDLHASTTRVRPGHAVTLYGHVRSAAGGVAGRTVRVWRKPNGGRWTLIASKQSLAPTGWWSKTVYPRRRTVFHVVLPATIYSLGASSRTVTIRMR